VVWKGHCQAAALFRYGSSNKRLINGIALDVFVFMLDLFAFGGKEAGNTD
jgi:hypothetical protein